MSSHQQPFGLTRFLYPHDEVELSLLTALLLKKDLQECYFWTFELYFSGCPIFPLIWKFYLDFYAELDRPPAKALKTYLKKKELANNVPAIAAIIRNLFLAKATATVFLYGPASSDTDLFNRIIGSIASSFGKHAAINSSDKKLIFFK